MTLAPARRAPSCTRRSLEATTTGRMAAQVMSDLRAHGVDMLTLGQYLQPSRNHLPVARYVHPDTFTMFEREALALGFRHAAVGALVRSSYHADRQAEEVLAESL